MTQPGRPSLSEEKKIDGHHPGYLGLRIRQCDICNSRPAVAVCQSCPSSLCTECIWRTHRCLQSAGELVRLTHEIIPYTISESASARDEQGTREACAVVFNSGKRGAISHTFLPQPEDHTAICSSIMDARPLQCRDGYMQRLLSNRDPAYAHDCASHASAWLPLP